MESYHSQAPFEMAGFCQFTLDILQRNNSTVSGNKMDNQGEWDEVYMFGTIHLLTSFLSTTSRASFAWEH